MTRLGTTLAVLFMMGATASTALAHEGHDDGGAHVVAETDIPRLESTGSELELVATAEGHTLTIFLDRRATNEPVSGAVIELSGHGGDPVTAKEVSAGTYRIDGEWVDEPGTKALIFTVTVGGKMDLLNGTLDVRAAAEDQGGGAGAAAEFLASPLFWITAGIAALVGFVVAFAFRPARLPPDGASRPEDQNAAHSDRRFRQAAELILIAAVLGAALAGPAVAHGDDDHGSAAPAPAGGNVPRKLPEGDVFVPKPSQRLLNVRTVVAKTETATIGTELIGTVISDPSAAGQVQAPMDGEIELSGRGISYVGQTVQAGEVLALLAPSMPVYERGALQQLTAEVAGKLIIAEQKLARLTKVGPGVVAQRDIDDTKAELDALREQKRVLSPKSAEKLLLKAPVSGVISVANVRPGQVVNARDTLFEIVDPRRLWIEAIAVAGHESGNVAAAHAVDADGHVIALEYMGQAPSLRQQAQPLLFRIADAHEGLAIGATVKVVTQGGDAGKGIVLPDSAVVRAPNGLPQVWTKIAPERFAPRPVRTRPLDGARVLVVAGLEDGVRVVTDGAELINQVR